MSMSFGIQNALRFTILYRRAEGYKAGTNRRNSGASFIFSGTSEEFPRVAVNSLRKGANDDFLVRAKALPGTTGSLPLEQIQKKIASWAIAGYLLVCPGKQNGNSGSIKESPER